MAYNDFTLEKLKQQFGLVVQEERTPVVSASPVALSDSYVTLWQKASRSLSTLAKKRVSNSSLHRC